MTASRRLLTAREVAELLGLSTSSVLRRWRKGEIPGFRLGSNVVRFRESEIEAWLDDRREAHTSATVLPLRPIKGGDNAR